MGKKYETLTTFVHFVLLMLLPRLAFSLPAEIHFRLANVKILSNAQMMHYYTTFLNILEEYGFYIRLLTVQDYILAGMFIYFMGLIITAIIVTASVKDIEHHADIVYVVTFLWPIAFGFYIVLKLCYLMYYLIALINHFVRRTANKK